MQMVLGGAGAAAIALIGALALDAVGGGETGRYVLAVNWQPAFCARRDRLPECRTQDAERFDATHFALHGLWPQPRERTYCDVDPALEATDRDGRWSELPPLDLEPETRAELERVMPGAASFLHRHEWLKHGTCYAGTAEEYVAESLQLMADLNGSAVQDLFAGAIGREIEADTVRAAADEAFGAGAGERIEVRCRDGLITELRLHLEGEITPSTRLGDLLLAAEPTTSWCTSGLVDPAG